MPTSERGEAEQGRNNCLPHFPARGDPRTCTKRVVHFLAVVHNLDAVTCVLGGSELLLEPNTACPTNSKASLNGGLAPLRPGERKKERTGC